MFERAQYTLHGTTACARNAHDLVGVETALGMAEQGGQHALLAFRKERIGDAVHRSHYGIDHTHFGCFIAP